MARDDDELWRAIVDNYGDRPEIDLDDDRPDPASSAAASPDHDPTDPADPADLADRPEQAEKPGWHDPDADWSSDRFVPPPPPPLPRTSKDRYLAWAGVFGSPGLLLVSLVLGISLPAIVAYALVAGFVGGFVYLVLKMPREPRDPGDDGAVL